MRTCEYCGINTDTRADNCPSCNAPLPPLPKPPPQTIVYTSRVRKSRNPVGVIAACAIALAVIGGAISSLSRVNGNPQTSRNASYGASATTPNATSSSEATPKTVAESLTNPSLRQIVEQYFSKEVGKLTHKDLSSIEFLYLKGDTAYLSDKPLWLPGTFEPELEMSQTTAVTYDGSWQNGLSLDCLTGLKTLAIEGVNGAIKDIPAMPELERLAIYSGSGVSDFTDFEKFPNLTELFVSGGSLVSLDGLSELARLEKLGLFGTGLTDLGLLSQTTTLKGLTLSGNKEMQGIQTLENMTWLTELAINKVDYSDLNFITKLTRLERLSVSGTRVKSLAFLSGLTKLKYLHLTGNSEIKTIPPLSVMTELEEICIDCSLTSDEALDDAAFLYGLSSVKKATLLGPNSLEPLRDFTSLQYLYLKLGWRLQDLSPLGSLDKLEYLRMYGRTYYELEGSGTIGSLSGLKELDLSTDEYSQNYINYDFVYKLTGLERLNISNTPVFGDFNGIGNLTNLRELILNKVDIHKSFQIYDQGGVTSIYFSDEIPLADFTNQFDKLVNLQRLELNQNDLTTLSFVANMPDLRVFLVSDNYITDASPLAGLTNLRFVDLSKNAVEDWHVLDPLIDTTIIR